ncbi:hypothetical protein [Flavobacterium eburneipallidum]|uniref:hypothetical protein n=1 Tax=Flavobacterium eburneipallidum TaxID=3003263 RepID=UPI0022AC2E01|nr:hypothetical protein [Flavobacterium eburneipallidum]
MKKIFLAITIAFALNSNAQSVAINNDGSTADNSAILDLKSNNQGVLVPRMTQTNRNAIATPATGLMIFQTDNTPAFYFNAGTPTTPNWQTVGGGSTMVYPNVELGVTNTTIQNIPDLVTVTTNTVLNFSTTNNANASLTGGNTWNGSVFTIGSTGAGWYQINAQVVGVTAAGGLSSLGVLYFMDKNNTVGNNKAGALYLSTIFTSGNTSDPVIRQASHLNSLIYLSAGDNIRFRAWSPSTTQAANTAADGRTFLNIVRIK